MPACRYALGVGLRPGCTAESLDALVQRLLVAYPISRPAIAFLATWDARAEAPAIIELSARLGLPVSGLSRERLMDVEACVITSSPRVRAHTGMASVAESAALAVFADSSAEVSLLDPRMVGEGATVALACQSCREPNAGSCDGLQYSSV